jgi:hypothetical protein
VEDRHGQDRRQWRSGQRCCISSGAKPVTARPADTWAAVTTHPGTSAAGRFQPVHMRPDAVPPMRCRIVGQWSWSRLRAALPSRLRSLRRLRASRRNARQGRHVPCRVGVLAAEFHSSRNRRNPMTTILDHFGLWVAAGRPRAPFRRVVDIS